MYEFLLERRHFSYLDNYLKFLRQLPSALSSVQYFSDFLTSTGHRLTAPPDTLRLRLMSSLSREYLERFEHTISTLRGEFDQHLNEISTFTHECRVMANATHNGGRRVLIRDLDYRRFSLSKSQAWKLFPPTEVRGLTHELFLRLDYLRSGFTGLKGTINELNDDIHSVFARFVFYLSMSACQCHTHRSRLEACYVSGNGVFAESLVFTATHSKPQRIAQSKQHLNEMTVLYNSAGSAINNLNDFLFAMRHFLYMAGFELERVKSSMTLAQLRLSLAEVMDRMQVVKSMFDSIQQWTRK